MVVDKHFLLLLVQHRAGIEEGSKSVDVGRKRSLSQSNSIMTCI